MVGTPGGDESACGRLSGIGLGGGLGGGAAGSFLALDAAETCEVIRRRWRGRLRGCSRDLLVWQGRRDRGLLKISASFYS